MKKEILFSLAIFLVIGLIAVSCASIQPAPDVKVELTDGRIALGKYLVEGPAACGYCHTPGAFLNDPMMEKHLSGAKIEDSNFTAYSANITPDVETGIGGWSDGEIIRAIREGVNKDDKTLSIAMPYGFYKAMSDNDVKAIVAYLRTVPPVKNKVLNPGIQRMAFPLNILIPFFTPAYTPVRDVPDLPLDDPIARGKYLLTIGDCRGCHSSGDPFAEDPDMAGGAEFGGPWGTVYAANLTSDPETGVFKKYNSDEEILENLKAAAMKMPMRSRAAYFKNMTDDDLRAILAYLRTLPPVKNEVPEPKGYIEEE